MAILRWGILGCGDVANYKGGPPLYTVEDSELVAVMRRDRAKAQVFAERHGAKWAYSDVDALLADNEVNAVYIATPPYLHCEHTIRAAQAGKHILCEKPMALTVEECQRMIDACRQAGVTLMIAYYRTFYPNIMRMKALMAEGAIGDVVLARINHTGFYEPSQHDSSSWRVNPEISGGGVLMDLGSHRIDLLQYLMGDIVSARGYAETVHLDIDVDDSAVFTLRFASGAHAVANINWNVGFSVDDVEVYGTEGCLRCSPLNSGNLTLEKAGNRFELDRVPLPHTHTGLIADFVNHLKTGAAIRCSGELGLKTNAIIAQIYQNQPIQNPVL